MPLYIDLARKADIVKTNINMYIKQTRYIYYIISKYLNRKSMYSYFILDSKIFLLQNMAVCVCLII